ncbi:hypothetical protein BKA62DRAFT_777047 [Auriculariales sp. MPI-PUGE-AT-0066]|nr:hypothetical protein BKA62DRAFT_777047 [Auriculariales sp. MPI-PUGE-AT-0066]
MDTLHISCTDKTIQYLSPHAPRVLVVGAGVIGMSTAWTLLDAGYNVTVVAKHFASRDVATPRLTSQIAGALWEYPAATTL